MSSEEKKFRLWGAKFKHRQVVKSMGAWWDVDGRYWYTLNEDHHNIIEDALRRGDFHIHQEYEDFCGLDPHDSYFFDVGNK